MTGPDGTHPCRRPSSAVPDIRASKNPYDLNVVSEASELAAGQYRLVVLIPVYNDWVAVAIVAAHLDRVLAGRHDGVQVVLVDDGSSESAPRERPPTKAIAAVTVLPLRRNLGHQRAIAIGLAYVEATMTCDAVVVMDGDGEDSPDDVPRLVEACRAGHDTQVVFAERTRRVDGTLFRGLYACYRFGHWLLTGVRVRVGNFSVIPASLLKRLVVVSELWNHYAAAVYIARVPRTSIETTRARRVHGQPHMNFVALVAHGLSAMSVHSEALAVRLFVGSVAGTIMFVGLLVTMASVSFYRGLATSPGVMVAGIVGLVVLAELIVLAMALAFRTLQGRTGSSFLPVRDYRFYIGDAVTVPVAEPTSPSALDGWK